MANATVAQSVNRQSVAQALQQARTEAATSMAWLNALNRAALNLEAGFWQFDGDTLVISSATKQGTRYTVSRDGCTCKAGQAHKPCWHRAARRLLCKAAELAQASRAVCPMCGAPIVGRQYYVGGRGYVHFEVCSGDGSHYGQPAA